MTNIAVLGAGAFGTSLAMALAMDGTPVMLWCRNASAADKMQNTRETGPRLPGHRLPDALIATSSISDVVADTILIAVPMQKLGGFLRSMPHLGDHSLIACSKGVDLETGLGSVGTINAAFPDARSALLTGPSFAADIASGLPTALVLACSDDEVGANLQQQLSRPALRLYRTEDVVGAELGGALKNVVALAAGMAMGAGFGDSARAAVIARGFAEMSRYATAQNALLETLRGLSGLGDLVLTCTSEKSRNFAAGQSFGRGEAPTSATIEGIATAVAVAKEATTIGMDMPITQAVAAVSSGKLDVSEAVQSLLSRPVKKE